MAESSTKKRKRGSVAVEPLTFQEFSPPVLEQMEKRKDQLKAAGLWDFLFKLEIAWPWQTDLSEFIESAWQSDFREIRVRSQSVSFSIEAIANITALPAEEGQPLTNSELPINAREWETVFEGEFKLLTMRLMDGRLRGQ